MEDKLIKLETELNLVKAELYRLKANQENYYVAELETELSSVKGELFELKAGLNHPESFYVTEVDIENFMKIYKIDSHDDLQHMVNFYIRQAFHRLTA